MWKRQYWMENCWFVTRHSWKNPVPCSISYRFCMLVSENVLNGKKKKCSDCASISFLIDNSFYGPLLLQAPPNPSSGRQLTSGNNEPHLACWRWRHLVPATARHQAKRQYTHTGSVVLFNEHIWANTWLPGGDVATPWRPGRALPLLFKPEGIKGGP